MLTGIYWQGKYLKALLIENFFNKLPTVQDEIDVIFYFAAEGDISTNLLSANN